MAKFYMSVCLLSVIWLTSSQAFLNPCKPKTGSTCSPDQTTLKRGDNLSVPLSNFGMIRDVCFQISSTSKWDSVCQFDRDGEFDGQICKPLIGDFKMHTSVKNKTLVMSNMNVENSGHYRILDVPGNCLEINVSVLDSEPRNSGNGNALSWRLILIPLVNVLIFCRCMGA